MSARLFRSLKIFFFVVTTTCVGGIVFFVFIKPPMVIVNEVRQGSRLGDQLAFYSSAKWFSYKYNIPLAVIPFKNYDELNLSQEACWAGLRCFHMRLLCKLFGRIIDVHTEEDIIHGLKTMHRPTRFVTSFRTHCPDMYTLAKQDPAFGKLLKSMFQPIASIKPLSLPHDQITVAVHVRKGGGYDPELSARQYYDSNVYNKNKNNQKSSGTSPTHNQATKPFADKLWPDKFPPEQFYVDQIKQLKKLLGHTIPLFVYIFTDDKYPQQLTERIKNHVCDNTITFSCKADNYSYRSHVIEDLAAMLQFDCLIRSASGFPNVVQFAGNFKITLYLEDLHWQDDTTLIIDKVGTIIDKDALTKRLALLTSNYVRTYAHA